MLSKRELFNKITNRGGKTYIKPPYFNKEIGFKECLKCDAKCVSACKRELLEFDEGIIKFSPKNIGCNFCKDCALACEFGVLDIKKADFIYAKTEIEVKNCLAWNDTICYSCSDICKFKAVEYLGVFRPVINDSCVNCGECLSACFSGAISFKSRSEF